MTHWGDSLASNASVLRLLTSDGKERSIALVGRRDLKIGSSPESDLVLGGPDVAPQHCRIYEHQGRLVLVDRGSRAGTLINDERCVQPTTLREGDRISIGFHLLLVMPGRAHATDEAIAEQMALQPQGWSTDEAALQAQFIQLLGQDARAWEARRRPARLLIGGDRLARAVALPQRPPELDPWLAASAARQRRRQGVRWLLSGLLPGLLLGALVAFPERPPAPAIPVDPSEPAAPPLAAGESPARPPTRRCSILSHTVIPHETLAEIATHYGVTEHEIAVSNNLSPGAPLVPDSRLNVCTSRPPLVRRRIDLTAGADDTWESLALRHGLTVERLRRFNPSLGPVLRPGDVVTLWAAPPAAPDVRDLAEPGTPDNSVSVGTTGNGELVNAVRLLSTEFFDVRCPRHAFVSSHTMTHLQGALLKLREGHNYRGQIVVGDLSQKAGGGFGNHLSHQSGRDVDLWLPIETGRYREDPRCAHCGTPWCRPKPEEVDWDATLRLIEALRDTGAVKNIFLDRRLHDPLREAARRSGMRAVDVDQLVQPQPGAPALVTHSANHRHHIHVRFRCGTNESGCSD